MGKLTEQDILRPFIGKTVNPETFAKVARRHSDKYLICNASYISDPLHCDLFRVTDRLQEQWAYSGVEFTMHLVVEDGVIIKAYLDKLRECGGGHGRPATKVLSISQQELRVARRILQYITNF